METDPQAMTTWLSLNRLIPLLLSTLFFVVTPVVVFVKIRGMGAERETWKRFALENGLETEPTPDFFTFVASPDRYPHYPTGRVYGTPKPGV